MDGRQVGDELASWVEAAQGELDAGKERALADVRVLAVQPGHQALDVCGGSAHAAASDLACQQGQGTGVVADRIDELADLSRRATGIGWLRRQPSRSITAATSSTASFGTGRPGERRSRNHRTGPEASAGW